MSLKNRQNGEVKIFVGADKLSTNLKNIIEFDELALKTNITGVNSGTNTGDETKAGLLTKLGIPGPFADDTAAAAGNVAVGGLYYVTTTLKLQVRLA